MFAVTSRLCFWICVVVITCSQRHASAEQKIITAECGQNVTLKCRSPNNNNILGVDWSRADLGDKYVLLYRDGHFDSDEQHPSFKNRVDLQDRQMKDGDVSLILKNVTINDTGKYECRLQQSGTNRRKRAVYDTDPICIINLRVVVPPGSGGGDTEDGGKKDGGKEDEVRRGHVGLIASLSAFSVFTFFGYLLIYKKHKDKRSHNGDEPSPAEG